MPYPFTVAQYHELTASGVLQDGAEVELLEGRIVKKTSRDPMHGATVQLVDLIVRQSIPPGWLVRVQSAMTTADSEPEPDLFVHRGGPREFLSRHPGPADIALVIEVANTSLRRDRVWKGRINATAGLAEYWIVNTLSGKVERYFTPQLGADGLLAYRDREDLSGDALLTPPIPGAKPIAARDMLP